MYRFDCVCHTNALVKLSPLTHDLKTSCKPWISDPADFWIFISITKGALKKWIFCNSRLKRLHSSTDKMGKSHALLVEKHLCLLLREIKWLICDAFRLRKTFRLCCFKLLAYLFRYLHDRNKHAGLNKVHKQDLSEYLTCLCMMWCVCLL